MRPSHPDKRILRESLHLIGNIVFEVEVSKTGEDAWGPDIRYMVKIVPTEGPEPEKPITKMFSFDNSKMRTKGSGSAHFDIAVWVVDLLMAFPYEGFNSITYDMRSRALVEKKRSVAAGPTAFYDRYKEACKRVVRAAERMCILMLVTDLSVCHALGDGDTITGEDIASAWDRGTVISVMDT